MSNKRLVSIYAFSYYLHFVPVVGVFYRPPWAYPRTCRFERDRSFLPVRMPPDPCHEHQHSYDRLHQNHDPVQNFKKTQCKQDDWWHSDITKPISPFRIQCFFQFFAIVFLHIFGRSVNRICNWFSLTPGFVIDIVALFIAKSSVKTLEKFTNIYDLVK